MSTRNRIILIIATVLLLAGVGGYFGFTNYLSQAEGTENTPEIQTALVRQGDIEIIASGVGEVVSASEVELSFSSSGVVAAVNVRVGQYVEAGEVLAEMGNLGSLQTAVDAAELTVLEYEQALQNLYDNQALNLANAQLELANAQQALNDANYYYQSAQPGYRGSDADYAATYANYVLALQSLEQAEDKYNQVSGLNPTNPEHAQALASLEAARQTIEGYETLLNWYDGEPTDVEDDEMLANIAIAEANVALAEEKVEQLTNGPDPDEVALAEARLQQARSSLKSANENLAGATLLAPFSGTILAVNGQVGETISGSFITIANLDQPLVQVFLDESDFDKIDLDYPVEVVFDALPDDIYTGKVIQVDPVLTTESNVPVITGLVQLDAMSADDLMQSLPISSNASVDVYAAQVQDATLVPVEALRELDDLTYAVFVIENGELVMRIVEVGLIDITYAEIISGIELGEEVSTGIVETE